MSTSMISIIRLLVTFQPQIFTTWTRLGATVTKDGTLCGPGGKRKKEKGITQTLYGKAVDELLPALEAQEKRREEAACEKKRKRQESESARACKQTEEISKACASLQAKGDAEKLSIADLITLLKWKGAEVPKDRSKNGKPAMVRAWIALAVSDEAIGAEASKAQQRRQLLIHLLRRPRSRRSGRRPRAMTRRRRATTRATMKKRRVRMRVRLRKSMQRARCSTRK